MLVVWKEIFKEKYYLQLFVFSSLSLIRITKLVIMLFSLL